MFGSLFLTVYSLFLLTYIGLMGYALYRVWIFGNNKELLGKTRHVSLVVFVVIASIIIASIIIMSRYNWDDTATFWLRQVFPEQKETITVNK
ncbi:hypothetical protein HYV44_02715 [Candidatus Microgenomates bacterium]|nr:hypothetical protein [Candidatus Microgenomates bacterium]